MTQPPPQPWNNPRPSPYAAPPPPRRPWWKATWVLVAAALVIGVLFGAGGASASKTSSAPDHTQTLTTSVTVTARETTTAPPVTRTRTLHPLVRKVVATRTQVETVTYTPPPPRQFGEGTYIVGRDIYPGTFYSKGSPDCYWARLSDLSGDFGSIITNHLGGGPQYLQVSPSDRAIQISGSCTFGRAS